jgi:hypothetical protein
MNWLLASLLLIALFIIFINRDNPKFPTNWVWVAVGVIVAKMIYDRRNKNKQKLNKQISEVPMPDRKG